MVGTDGMGALTIRRRVGQAFWLHLPDGQRASVERVGGDPAEWPEALRVRKLPEADQCRTA